MGDFNINLTKFNTFKSFLSYHLPINHNVMKVIYTFLALVTLVSSLHGADIDIRYYTGLWHMPHSSRTIEVLAYKDGFKIKGLNSNYIHTWFERLQKNTLRDNAGNTIRLVDGTLVYYPRRSNTIMTLYKVKSTSNNNKPIKDKKEYPTSQNNIKSNSNKIFTYKNKVYDLTSVNVDKIEGTWLAEGIDRLVYITYTRDGIKARLVDDKTWYHYSLHKTDEYTASDGQRYNYEAPYLFWYDKSSQRKIQLIKLSDDLIDSE